MPRTDGEENVSPTQPSVASTHMRSPAVDSTFSQADTILTRNSQYTANTGGRARQSWRDGIGTFLHTSRFLSNDPTQITPPMSSVTPRYTAINHNSPVAGQERRGAVTLVELCASPITGPDEPRSFFDSDSESDGEPVISRASSVRAQRPKLVEHHSTTSGRSLRVYESPHGAMQSPRPTLNESELLLAILLKHPNGLTPTTESLNPVDIVGGPAEALSVLTANAVDQASTTALAPTPPSPQLSFTPSSILDVPDTPTRIEALDTLPSPMGGFGTIRVPQTPPSRKVAVLLGTSAVDGLRSHPVHGMEVSGLQRAISAPPLPFRNSNRKVTIRPLDLTSVHDPSGRRLFRESVVTTPYPTRNGSLGFSEVSPLSAIANARIADALPPTKEERDRFPSPSRPEILLLELALARHLAGTTTVQIEVEDKGTFDDEALFRILRKSYNSSLLGLVRRFAVAKRLTSATSTDPNFDANNFLQHLRRPGLGHKRKTWLAWLRAQQTKVKRNGSRGTGHGVSFYSPSSTPRMPFTAFDVKEDGKPPPPTITFHFEFSPAKIALACFAIVSLSCAAAIVWVLFGVPGAGLAQGHGDRTGVASETWRHNAAQRVVTGLVLGVFVSLLGTLGAVAWILGSWLLL